MIKEVKNTLPLTYFINRSLILLELIGTFYEKTLQKTNQQKIWIEKVIKKKGDKCQMERL